MIHATAVITPDTLVSSIARGPSDNSMLRRAIYGGAIFKVDAGAASLRLAEAIRAFVQSEMGADFNNECDLESAPSGEYAKKLVGCLQKLKPIIYADETVRALADALLAELGFASQNCWYDPVRLRAVPPKEFVSAGVLASPVYALHRDTWYSNPQSQITFWMPLHDVDERQTFAFLPDYFARPVPNTSDKFDYVNWTKEVGFGNSESVGESKFYPLATDTRLTPADGLAFKAAKGDVLLFSGSHLHGTLPNTSSFTRFSIDFRYVNQDDEAAGLGAPNTDSRATGSATRDYVKPNLVSNS